MINKSLIFSKFESLDNCLKRIEYAVNKDLKNLQKQDNQDIFVLNLQRACQITIDVAAHILKDEGFQIPNTVREYFKILNKEDFIATELSDSLTKMVGFRNIAVHDYEEIDTKILESIFKNHIDEFKQFKSQILKSFGVIEAK